MKTALISTSGFVGTTLLKEHQKCEMLNVNLRQIHLFEQLSKYHDGYLEGKTIALWGVNFKLETDDMCEVTALVMIDLLLNAGCTVQVFDPVSMEECRGRIGDTVIYANDMYEAVLNADALLLLTEWKLFRLPSWGVLKKTMNELLILDGRNIYEKKELEELGFNYFCIGK